MTQTKETKRLAATPDLNLAAYIKVVKKIKTAGYYLLERQLWIRFDISPRQLATFKEEYVNSDFAACNDTKRNFIRLLATE